MEYDFSGWATKNNIQCSDGRTILKDAFKDNDGQKVPLVWNHQHDNPTEVLGHAILENRDDGVYAYCKFNNTESGNIAKELVHNGDVNQLSIYANKLKTKMNNVMHGCIREVSLVLAGANPGAYIDSIMIHSDEEGEEAIIYNNEIIDNSDAIEHSDSSEGTVSESSEKASDEKEEKQDESEKEDKKETQKEDKKEEDKMETENEKTIGEIFDTLNDEQKEAVYALVGQAVDDATNQDDGGEDMKHNVFDNEEEGEVLQHSEILASAIQDAKRYGSLRDSVIEHAAINNITDINKLFPDATALNKEPIMIEEDNSWVAKVMRAVKHSPFSRVKVTFGRLTEPQARAKGYIKGNQKLNIQMAALNRVVTPTTVYIKNEIDRDDVVDITDFDVVAWQKREMRKQLDKELARAMLLGDGRDVSDQSKINELNIIPVAKDVDTYTIKYTITSGTDYNQTGNSASENDSFTKGIIRAALRSRKQYKGSGTPSFYTTEDILNDMLLIEDQNGRRIYNSVNDLALALRVKEIVSVNMFDDFDIDYNQMKYLMETRMSGALTVPYSAIVLQRTAQNAQNNEQPQG